MTSVDSLDSKALIALTKNVEIIEVRRPGNIPGTKKYDLKKYCKKCSKWLFPDMWHTGVRGYIFCNDCGQRVRNKPRLGQMREKYWTGKRM